MKNGPYETGTGAACTQIFIADVGFMHVHIFSAERLSVTITLGSFEGLTFELKDWLPKCVIVRHFQFQVAISACCKDLPPCGLEQALIKFLY